MTELTCKQRMAVVVSAVLWLAVAAAAAFFLSFSSFSFLGGL